MPKASKWDSTYLAPSHKSPFTLSAAMKCPNCQSENPAEAKFCMECGYRLISASSTASRVLSFDEKLEKLQRYLPSGLIENILTQRDKIEGEHKQVTIMFCDMKGYTPLTEKLGPEATFSLMDQVYEILIQKVYEYQGTVNELRGDGILAFFGAPLALEDAPQRAIWSALAIHREISRFNDRKMEIIPIKMRIGIHTGPVVVGTLGNDLRVEFKAVGDTVNLASRMEGLAEPGTTYVTKQTYQLTKDFFHFETLGEKAVKGKEETIPVYRVLSSKEDVYRSRLVSERRIYSEMVGRKAELDRLTLQVRKAINGEGSIVNIIGEAGIGKSRLVAELRKRALLERVNLFEGRAISIGKNLSFHPIIDLLKRWAWIEKDDGELEKFNKLEAAVRRQYPEEAGEVFPFIAILMGMKLSGKYAERVKDLEGEALEKLILKNVRDLFIKAAEDTPLVIVTEDLHWADTSSIELMESIFRLAETYKILFINLFRPGFKETGDRIVETIKERLPVKYVEIALTPLDERMSEVLINNMLSIRALHYVVIQQIVQRSGGNPFFIEEIVRSLIDEGAVVLKEGIFEATEKIHQIAIPNTINDLLMARIDRLEEETRSLVKLASVIGRNFFYRVIVDVASIVKDIDGRLSYLKEIQLIRERERMREIEYLFKHALTQETAYESILPNKRKELHLKVAGSIEKIFNDRLHEFYGMLAYHYSNAENMDKAEEYLLKAGEEALKSSASSEALNYYQDTLSLYLKKYGDDGDPDKLAMLEKNIALALFNKGQYPDAMKYFDSVLERWGVRSSRNRLFRTFELVSNLLNLIVTLYLPSKKPKKIPSKREHEIIALAEKKITALAFFQPSRYFGEALRVIRWVSKLDFTKLQNGVSRYSGASTLFSWTGLSFRLSKKILDHVKGLINEEDRREILNYRLFQLYHDFFTGDWSGYKEIDESLLNYNLKFGQTWQVSTYIFFRCSIKIEQGYFSEAEELISKMYEIWSNYKNENTRGYIHSLKIRLFTKSRNLNDAQVEVDERLSFASRTRSDLTILFFAGFKAIAQILSKDIGGARESLARAKVFLSRESHRIPYFISSYLLGQFLMDLYLLEEALLSSDRSKPSKYSKRAFKSGKLALKNSRKLACDRIEVFRLMGLYYWLINSQNKAIGWWRRSMAEGERLGDRVELSRTHMEIGRRLLEKRSKFRELDRVEPEAYLEKARISFGQMGLDWDLGELEKITIDG